MGERVRVLRAVRGYSQARLSELTGLSRQYLSEVEKGKRPRPQCQTVERLAAALGVPVEELKGEPPARTPPPAPEGEGQGSPRPVVDVPEHLGAIAAVARLLAELPPGLAVLHHSYPDGSVLLYIRKPAARATRVRPPGRRRRGRP